MLPGGLQGHYKRPSNGHKPLSLTLPETHHMHEPAVFRHLAIPLSVFDRIKAVQRSLEAATGQHITLIQTIAVIVREHQQNEEREARNQASKQPAILRNLGA